MSEESTPSVTVDDLKVRMCFVCREEDTSPSNEGRFVHPCRCTLVAHQPCLLLWIDSGGDSRKRCAQCKELYQIVVRRRSILLRVMQAANRLLSRLGAVCLFGSFIFAVAALILGAMLVCASYGYYIAWWTLGPDIFERHVQDPRQWSRKMLALVPLAIPQAFFSLASNSTWPGTRFGYAKWLIMWLPMLPLKRYFLPALPLRDWLLSWPPHPGVVAVLFPPAHVCYLRVLHAVQACLLDFPGVRREQMKNGGPAAAAPAHAAAVIEVVDNGGRAPDDGAPNDQLGNWENFRRAINGIEPGSGRTLLSMLALPPLGYYVGRLLRRLTSSSQPIRLILGARTAAGVELSEPDWWCSVVALSIILVCKDCIALLYMCLLQGDDDSRDIVDMPFVNVDVSSELPADHDPAAL
ncbi:hypothetical protein EXIGLDRAFT_146741 [Exidia glandulosa HHB12029]|uniref:RING-CH-type domain-containing protein n=1 Tax=Exidia glandulosa HHB12029 TaxID=1314781 RepID=A0A166A8D0_EXIGL|nr:hypothetical protein EXIGLDRAFT_146741 [Exidia glandulosa HHB12029]